MYHMGYTNKQPSKRKIRWMLAEKLTREHKGSTIPLIDKDKDLLYTLDVKEVVKALLT